MNTFTYNMRAIYGSRGEAWLRQLPEQVKMLAERFGLSGLTVVPNLSFNYVLTGFQGKQPVVLKLGLDVEALARESMALRVFAGYGAVELLAEIEGGMLLAQAQPGYSLKQYLANEERDVIAICCQVMQRLHEAPLPTAGIFPPISVWLQTIDRDWELPKAYLRKARALKSKLLAQAQAPVLLHGDLHHDNILAHEGDWRIIDPKGVVGPPIFETWAFIKDIQQDTLYVAERFNFDLHEVREWYFVHLILVSCWNLSDHLVPEPFLALAHQAYALL